MTTTPTLVISNKDIFNYLKVCMYSESIHELRQTGKEIHSGIFYETIQMLDKVEFGLTKIEENIISTQSAYLDSDDDTKEDIIDYLNLLRLDRELIGFADKADTLFSIQASLFIRLVDEEFPEFYADGHNWTKSNLPLNRIFDCIAKYRQKYELSRESIHQDLVDCNNRHIELAEVFSKIVRKTKKVYVLSLMIKISPNFSRERLASSSWNQNNIEHVMEALRSSYADIVANFHVYADFVNTFMGTNESLNFCVVLVLKNDREYDSKLIALKIEHILKTDLNQRSIYSRYDDYDIKVYSLNERIRLHFKHRQVTDVLGYRPKKQLEDFNYWYLYLFTHFERFIKAERNRHRHFAFDIHEVGYRVSRLLHEIKNPAPESRPTRSKKTAKDITLSSLYREFSDDGLWEKAIYRLNNKKEYAGLCHIYDEQKHFFQFERDTSEQLKQLELFIQYLKYADISPISSVDAELGHIIQSPKRYLSLIEKLAIILIQDHYLDQVSTENLNYILKGTLSPNLRFFLREHNNNRDVVNLLNNEIFSLDFYKGLHKYLYDLKVELHKSDIATEQAKGSANEQKNYKSINEYLRYKFKKDVDVYRFRMTCRFGTQNVPEALLCAAFSEIWTEFVKDIKRKPKIFGKQLVAHVGTYVSLTVPLIDITLIFDSANKGDFRINTVQKINEFWRGYLTDTFKEQLIRKLEKRRQSVKQTNNVLSVDYNDFFSKLSLESIELPLIHERRKRQGDYLLLCNYKDKKQRSRFIKALAEYYANYSLLKRASIEGREIKLNLLLKGRLPQHEENMIPERIQKLSNNYGQSTVEEGNETVTKASQQDEHPDDSGVPIPETPLSVDDQDISEQNQAETKSEDQPETILHTQNIEQSFPIDSSDQVVTLEPIENHLDQAGKNMMTGRKVEVHKKKVFVASPKAKPKDS